MTDSTQRVVTLQRHIVEQQKLHPAASGAFTSLLWDLVLAIKMTAREVRRAGLIDILGAAGGQNVHGEKVQKLDQYAQDRLVSGLSRTGQLCCMASEESAEVISIPEGYPRGKYVVLFDPLDGSSNIDVNISIGTVFSIHRRVTAGEEGTLEDCLQPGSRQLAAGYVIYGSSTMLVYTTGKGVHGFTLDPSVGEFLLSHPDIRIPNKGRTYSVNEGNSWGWDSGTAKYVRWIKERDPAGGRPYTHRYVGTLVADFHRTLLKGGIYLYPATPKPKLRLLYEAAPLAFIAECAGGLASTGTQRLLDVVPKELHERTGLVVGSPEDVARYREFVAQAGERRSPKNDTSDSKTAGRGPLLS